LYRVLALVLTWAHRAGKGHLIAPVERRIANLRAYLARGVVDGDTEVGIARELQHFRRIWDEFRRGEGRPR
jgi:hypothetical protein